MHARPGSVDPSRALCMHPSHKQDITDKCVMPDLPHDQREVELFRNKNRPNFDSDSGDV